MQFEKHSAMAVEMLVTICDRDKTQKVLSVLQGEKAFFNLAMLARGAATSRILNYFGLSQTEKTVLMTILPTQRAAQAMAAVDGALKLNNPGHGIAFSARVPQGCYHKPVQFAEHSEGEKTMDAQHDLIVVILNRGYSEEVMELAGQAGAGGGTVLHARGCGLEGAQKFFGITIQPEKELILLVVKDAASQDIMQAVAQGAGPGTQASAVSFCMPLSAVCGLEQEILPGV